MSGLDLWPWNGSTVRTTPVAEPRFIVFQSVAGPTVARCIGIHSTRADLVAHLIALDGTADVVAAVNDGASLEHGTERIWHTHNDDDGNPVFTSISLAEDYTSGDVAGYDDPSLPYPQALLDFIIPPVDRNGNPWSLQQRAANEEKAWKVITGTARIAVGAVAGSGKSSLVKGMVESVARWNPTLPVSITAFNTHIAEDAMADLKHLAKVYGLAIKILGGSNTVNAGGHAMNRAKAAAEGFTIHPKESRLDGSNDPYIILPRIVLAGAMGDPSYGLDIRTLVIAKGALNVKTTSHAFNDLSRGLTAVCEMLMNEGFVPRSMATPVVDGYVIPSVEDESMNNDEIQEVVGILKRVGKDQGLDDNPVVSIGLPVVARLAITVLALRVQTAFIRAKHRPSCGEADWMNAVVPAKDSRGYWLDAGVLKDLNNHRDASKITAQRYAILTSGNVLFPPAGKATKGISSKSFATNATTKAVVKMVGDDIALTFENDGQKAKLDGVWIGRQFGKAGTFKVDGKRVALMAPFNGTKGYRLVKPKHLDTVISVLADVFKEGEVDVRLDGVDLPSDDDFAEVESQGIWYWSMPDQIYLPHALDLQLPEHEKARCMMVDEVQDLSVLKASLVWKLCTDDAHITIVGDTSQAIYLFAGASSTAFHDNAEAIGATWFPQSVCWRGTAMVAASARVACADALAMVKRRYPNEDYTTCNYHNHFSPAHPAVADQFAHLNWSQGALPMVINGDSVVGFVENARTLLGEDTTFGLLCRLKRPLPDYIKRLLKAGIPVSTPSGKDGLVNQAFKATAERPRTDSKILNDGWQVSKLSRLGLGWKDAPLRNFTLRIAITQIEELKKHTMLKWTDFHGGDAKQLATCPNFEEAIAAIDLIEAFTTLFFERVSKDDIRASGDTTIAKGLRAWVENTLFSKKGGSAVHISTIHRYKGDEADVMFLIDRIVNPSPESDQPFVSCFMSERSMEASFESAIGEVNNAYVAWTRAKKWNVIVDESVDFYADLKATMMKAIEGDYEAVLDAPRSADAPTPVEDASSGLERCCDEGCGKVIPDLDDTRICAGCGGHLCRVRDDQARPCPLQSCGSPTGRSFADQFEVEDPTLDYDEILCTACQDEARLEEVNQ